MRAHRVILKDGFYWPQYEDAWYPWVGYGQTAFITRWEAVDFILDKIERERVRDLPPEVVWHD